MRPILHKLSSFAVPCQRIHNLLQPLGELRTLHSRYQQICLNSVSLTNVYPEDTTFRTETITIYIRRSYVAAGFQTYK